jgi:hypothetical protein
MDKINQLKAYFARNPVMAFVAIIVLVTVILGGIAMAGSMTANKEDEEQIAKVEDKDEDKDAEEAEDKKQIEDEEEVEDEDEEPSPTKKPVATSTPAATSAPSATPTPEDKKFNYNFLGDIYEDKNCNGSADSGEGRMSSITVNLFKSDGSAFNSVKSDGTGHYSYASSLKEGESISLKGEPVVPSTHILKPGTSFTTIEFKQGNNSGGQNFFLVPNESKDQCSA